MAQKKRSIELTQVTQWEDGKAAHVEDYLAVEEPLEMRARRYSLGVTLRTPGDDQELVAGFLFTEGIISRRKEIVALRMPSDKDPERNLVRVTLDPSVRLATNSAARRFSAGSACGVCGKASITQLRRRGLRRLEAAALFNPETLCELPPRLRAAALFAPGGELLVLGEDIGRHNAVDKVIGWALLDGRVPLSGQVFARGDRLLRDLLPTATADHIPLPASVSAPSESRGTTGAPTTIDTGRFSARAAPRRLRQRGADRGYRFGIGRRPPQE